MERLTENSSALLNALSAATATTVPKPILVMFYMDNCPACEKCKEYIAESYTDEEKSRIIRINVRDEGEIRSIVVGNGIKAIPTIYKISLRENTVSEPIEGFDKRALDALFRSP
jgi:thioredoxin-like negative regulator of GroEL